MEESVGDGVGSVELGLGGVCEELCRDLEDGYYSMSLSMFFSASFLREWKG